MTFFLPQILGVTADNASNNDKMIEHLATLIDTFPGAANQTRCFAHILNLVAKHVLQQFEGPKKGKVVDDKELEAVVDEIMGADDEDLSDGGTNDGGDECEDVDDEVIDDDEDGLQDEEEEMSEEELRSVKESVKPIRIVLTKVSQLNKYKHQSTNQLRIYSFEVYLKLSKTLPPSSFLSGTRYSKVLPSSNG